MLDSWYVNSVIGVKYISIVVSGFTVNYASIKNQGPV